MKEITAVNIAVNILIELRKVRSSVVIFGSERYSRVMQKSSEISSFTAEEKTVGAKQYANGRSCHIQDGFELMISIYFFKHSSQQSTAGRKIRSRQTSMNHQ